jgi:hypothetical protein
MLYTPLHLHSIDHRPKLSYAFAVAANLWLLGRLLQCLQHTSQPMLAVGLPGWQVLLDGLRRIAGGSVETH